LSTPSKHAVSSDCLSNRRFPALTRVLRLPGIPGALRRTLYLQLSLLDEASPAEPALPWADNWQPSPLDRRYLPAARLSALLLRRLVLSEAAGSTAACSLLVDMNQLFERFIEQGLRRRLQAADRTIRVLGQEQWYLDVEKNRLIIRPDVVVRRGSATTFVLDSKSSWQATARRTWTTMLSCSCTRSGMTSRTLPWSTLLSHRSRGKQPTW
jgi:5-methylcytosine-specific restriction enzyme subunit McrC